MDTQLKLIGKGATAEVFQWEEGKILKLFYSFISKETCNLEYESSRLISSHFSFLPKAYEIIERDNRCGIIYEKVSGPTMMAALLHNLKACKSYSKRLALIQTGYQKEISFSLISVKEKLRNDINRTVKLEKAEKEAICTYLEKLPDGSSLCHFDFHPDNVILTEQGPMIIDWMTACKGDPYADSARTKILIIHSFVPGVSPGLQTILKFFKRRIYSSYIKEYQRQTGCTLKDIQMWELPIAAARLAEERPSEEEARLLKLVRKQLLIKGSV